MQQLHASRGLRQGALRRSAATVGPQERLGCVAQQRGASRLSVAAAASKVVLTREHGKNDKLQKALSKHGLECIELPLIEHAPGPDRPSLPAVIKAGEYDWITVTSPEAAAVFLEAWAEAGRPEVRTAVVGGGTGEILQQGGVAPQYVSSKATGKTLGAELPKLAGGSNVVLYPASAKASDDLQGSLESSGFTVKRLNTYNTVGVTDVPASLLASAMTADVVTFGSPSAVKAWVALVGLPTANQKACACIGATSAKACNGIGLKHVFFPESPGIEGWVESVLQALKHQEQLAQPVA